MCFAYLCLTGSQNEESNDRIPSDIIEKFVELGTIDDSFFTKSQLKAPELSEKNFSKDVFVDQTFLWMVYYRFTLFYLCIGLLINLMFSFGASRLSKR